ncbi:hypothetical protein ABZV78_30530, partial [Micromonospora sp. NPDC004540]|uniref:hypothetical protein n=1 Tax=Micromonospora sp. NPDC004540 TaxID=3154457 RepID=UPI0033BA6C7B
PAGGGRAGAARFAGRLDLIERNSANVAPAGHVVSRLMLYIGIRTSVTLRRVLSAEMNSGMQGR